MAEVQAPAAAEAQPMRKNGQTGLQLSFGCYLTEWIGKNWHGKQKAFRPTAGQTPYEKRAAREKELAVVKAHEKELKEEKEAERQVRRLCTNFKRQH